MNSLSRNGGDSRSSVLSRGAPAQASAFGYVRPLFFTDFDTLDEVDINDFKTANYSWFINNYWPAAAASNANAEWDPTMRLATPPSSRLYSISTPSILRMHPGAKLQSACPDGSGGFFGSAFGGGFYAEATLKFEAASKIQSHWPAWWGFPIEFCLGTAVRGNEIDFAEAFPGAERMQGLIHDWVLSTIPNGNVQSAVGQLVVPNNIFYRYGFRWVPIARNNGMGSFDWYVNDEPVHSVSYTAESAYFRYGESHSYVLKFTAGGVHSPDLYIDDVAVWGF